jgi:hypothetical protein
MTANQKREFIRTLHNETAERLESARKNKVILDATDHNQLIWCVAEEVTLRNVLAILEKPE